MHAFEDVDRDGDLDLVAYFDQSALERNRDLTSATTELVLAGVLGDGRCVRGTDRVVVR
ncbi:MAG TPA: hypothetical protein VKA84_11400 [Gemmatimonadaceae bacterium]|nr:hypothetical protein [Gemmatimonadaceae bacterium]